MKETEEYKAACAELERLTRLSVAFFNDREFNITTEAGREVLLHVSPACQVQFDNYSQLMSLDDFFKIAKQRVDDDASVHFTPKQITSQIDLKQALGVTYLEDEKSDSTGLTLIGLCEMKWQMWDGKWMLYRFSRMYSMKGTTGTDWFP